MATVMNGGRRVTTHEAQITTATIEVRSLTLNARQVTLSVFRQLQHEDILPRCGMGQQSGVITRGVPVLQGTPWGSVNYFWKGCDPDLDEGEVPGSRLHVVWQQGQELRRSIVYAQGAHAPNTSPYYCRLETERLAEELMARRILAGVEPHEGKGPHRHSIVVPDVGEYGVRVELRAAARDLLSYGTFNGNDETKLRRQLEQSVHASTSDADLLSTANIWYGLWQQQDALWSAQYDALAALDQLFIAV